MPPRAKLAEGARRSLIAFDAEAWQALHLLAKESGRPLQQLAEEAFADLLKKHHRPVTLKQALQASARRLPANDAPVRKRRKT